MASIGTTSNRIGTGCLMLFALPFATVGVGALGWAGMQLLDWRTASGWAATSAEIVSLELEEHYGDDSTTYETTATYRYDYAGQNLHGQPRRDRHRRRQHR